MVRGWARRGWDNARTSASTGARPASRPSSRRSESPPENSLRRGEEAGGPESGPSILRQVTVSTSPPQLRARSGADREIGIIDETTRGSMARQSRAKSSNNRSCARNRNRIDPWPGSKLASKVRRRCVRPKPEHALPKCQRANQAIRVPNRSLWRRDRARKTVVTCRGCVSPRPVRCKAGRGCQDRLHLSPGN